jgi:very-short-patch-repair endonuclease
MIDLSRTSAQAVKDLKHYLDFAARGPVALGEAIQSVSLSRYDSDFELAIAELLRGRGWTVHTQIGVSKFRIDLAVVHPDAPGRYLAGIECDGATYHSSPSARDRDRVRHIILEQLGWRLARIWSTDFFVDPESAVGALDAKLRTLLEADREAARVTSAAALVASPLPDASTWDASAETPEEGETQHEAFQPEREVNRLDAIEGGEEVLEDGDAEPTGPSELQLVRRVARGARLDEPSAPVSYDASRFHDPGYRRDLQEFAASVIDAEGPVTFKRLSDRIARAHGFQRTGRQISSTVWAACKNLRRYVPTPDGHKVFWPLGMEPAEFVRYRGREIAGQLREWREVPYPEKLWLLRKVVADGHSDAARAIAEEIGFGRVTESFKAEISALLRRLARGEA